MIAWRDGKRNATDEDLNTDGESSREMSANQSQNHTRKRISQVYGGPRNTQVFFQANTEHAFLMQ